MAVVDLVEHVAQRLAALAPGARRVALGVSGGADSVAALWLLHGARIELVAVHLDHGLREEAPADAAFVAELCANLAVPLVAERVDVARVARARGWNLEDAGRRVRYALLTRVARERACDAVVTAHTLDDVAETVLMQLLRGRAQPLGIAPRRGRIVRPLLDVARARLRSWLDDHGHTWREDASNADTERARAWVRHVLLPLVRERYPEPEPALAATAARQRELRAFVEAEVARRFGRGPLHRDALRRAAPVLQRTALAALLARAGEEPRAAVLEAAREALEHERPWRAQLSRAATLRVAYDRVEVVGPPPAPPPARAVSGPGDLPQGVDPAVLERFPGLELRARLPGDRIRLAGGRRLLSDVLIDRKVPREERDALRVLAAGSEVLWVEGTVAAADLAVEEPDHERALMLRALELARAAGERGELPVGALVWRDGEVLAEATNRGRGDRDPTAHAEILALREAAARAGDRRLVGATLVVTLEPCPMCYGAVLQTHLARVVYGADNRREGALGSVVDLRAGDWKRAPEVRGGLLARTSARLLETFFEVRRSPRP